MTKLLTNCGLTKNLWKLLKAKTLRTKNVIINIFGMLYKPKLETADVVQVKVKHQFTNEYTFIKALSYTLLCKPMKNQDIALAKKSYEKLSRFSRF